MNILITICARGGSKGIPGKNIRLLGGKPLIAYTINTARLFAQDKPAVLALSTDSEEINGVAARLGLVSSYKRPEELSTDTAGKISTIQHLLEYEEQRNNTRFDFILDLDVTSPLRTPADLEAAFKDLVEDKDALNIFSVNPANRNPYFNMVEQNETGYVDLCKKGKFLTRQSAPKVYDMNASFYIYRRSFFEKGLTGVITDKSLVYVMPHICFDLDHQIDFDFMQYLLENNKLEGAL